MSLLRRFLFVSALLALAACDSVEERAENHYQVALTHIANGDTDRAIVELRNVFDLNSNHVDARLKMAELLDQRGDIRGAYRQYLHLAELDPDDLETRIILSEMAFLGGNWDEVERHGARIEELAPEDPRVQGVTLVRAYRAAAGDRNTTELRKLGEAADEMLTQQPDNPLLHNTMVDYSMRTQDFTRALAEIDWMIAFDPKNERNYLDRLRILERLGDVTGVEGQLRDLIGLFPDNATHKETLIRFYLSRKDLDAAEGFLRELAATADPEDTQPLLQLIQFLVELRGPDAARAELQKAIETQSDPTPFQTLAAGIDFTQGAQNKAIASLEALVQDAEPSEQINNAKVALARMLQNTGDEDGARIRVDEVLAANDTHTGALKMKAAWQIDADETDAALAGLRTVIDQSPDDAEALSLTATAYARAGQSELTRDTLARAAQASGNAPAESLRFARFLINEESYLAAEDTLLSSLRLGPPDRDVLVTLGDVYLRMGDFGRAQGVADALRRLGGDTAVQAANGIEAERLNQQQGIDAALAFLEDLSNAEDATLATRVALIEAQIGVGDTAGAVALAQELAAENPENESLNIVLAVTHALDGNLDVATSLYQELLETEPSRPSIWLELSRLQRRQGARETAIAAVDEGLTHTPEAPNLLWAKASFSQQDGDIDGAIAIYEEMYERDSSSLVVANNLASLLATYRDDEASLDRAWAIARRLRGMEVPALQDTYGWILHRRGDTEEAISYLENAVEGLPNEPVVKSHLGQAYRAAGRTEEALEQLRSAITIAGPADTRPQIETARALIQELIDLEAQEN